MNRISFNYPLKVAVVTPDGNMVSWRFGCGATLDYIPQTLASDDQENVDFELEDGNLLQDVPLSAIHFE